MALLCYLLRRALAIVLGVALTAYSAWASWHHQGDLIGPLAAISAAALLAFAEHAWRDRQKLSAVLLGVLGLAAAVISGSVVLDRVAHTQATTVQAAKSSNLPRSQAQAALAEAKVALVAAEKAASANCGSGRGPQCKALEQRELAARKRVEEARSKLVGLGAETAEDPAGAILGDHAATLRLAVLLGLPLWLELAAPVVLAYGFAPAPRQKDAPKVKRRRRATRKAPRKPTEPSAKVGTAQPRLKLVAANDH
jgi:hypothetical protein